MTDAEFDAMSREAHRKLDALMVRVGRLAQRVESMRDDVRILRWELEIERDLDAEIQ